MDRSSDRSTEPASRPPYVAHVLHVSVQPKTWFGKLIVATVGLAVMLIAFLLSVIVFAVIVSLIIVAVIYVMWVVHKTRRAKLRDAIDIDSKELGR